MSVVNIVCVFLFLCLQVLKRPEYFGRFGKIHKVVINNSTSYAGSQVRGWVKLIGSTGEADVEVRSNS